MDIIKGTGEQSPLFIRNCWYVAAWCHEIKVHQMHSLDIINKPVLIYRKEDGTLTAMANQCCHRHAPPVLGSTGGR